MKKFRLYYIILVILISCETEKKQQTKDSESKSTEKTIHITSYTNPIMWADVPDLSITRKGNAYYLISTTMHLMPGAPVMRSYDLVNWEPVSYVFDSLHDTPKYDLKEGTVYGRGQWASSIRFYNNKYYVLFSPNDEPFQSYLYTTDNPAGKWELVSRMPHFHDASLFFDDNGKVYVFYGTGNLVELKSDLSDVKEDGIATKIFERDIEETGLLEGSQVIKHNDYYYLLMISWPKNGKRRQVCYRAKNITGPYEKKVILESDFAGFPNVGQGCIIDDESGNWYGLVFQDRGGVGRVPLLMPCNWIDNWPMLGDSKGKVPIAGTIPLAAKPSQNTIVASDSFSSNKLKIQWQWNHNPINSAWSLTERPGFLRLRTSRVTNNLYTAPNTITQRMEGPECTGIVKLDISHMNVGDVAGFAAFNGASGILSVLKEKEGTYLTMSTNNVSLDSKTKAVTHIDTKELDRVTINQSEIYLKIEADFRLNRDIATFYYSFDGYNFKQIGSDFKMIFDYRKLFMGTRFAIFNYATKATGGYVDVDYFNYTLNNTENTLN